MCLVISMIALFLSYTYFTANNYVAAGGSLVVGVVSLFFMIRNVLHVKKLKKGSENDN